MKRLTRHTNAKRRTTVTLPSAALRQAERIARSRNVTLSTVLAEGLDQVLRNQADADRRKAAWDAYCESLRGFSEDQLTTLDGIILKPKRR